MCVRVRVCICECTHAWVNAQNIVMAVKVIAVIVMVAVITIVIIKIIIRLNPKIRITLL